MSIYHGYYYSLLAVAGVLGLVTAGRKGSLSLRLVAWLPLITMPVETLALLAGYYYHINHWVYNLWLPLECCCLLLVLYTGARHPVAKRLIGWLLVLLPAGIVAAYCANPSISHINVVAMLFCLFCELIGGFIFILTHATWLFAINVFRMWYGWLVLLGNTFLYGGMILTFIVLRRK
jgi:hypothetical protein